MIDDLTREENVEPAYEIYAVFRKRYNERMDYVMKNLMIVMNVHENDDMANKKTKQ